MRNPTRSRNLSLAIFLAGIAAATTAFVMPDAGKGFTLQAVLGITGITLIPLAGVAALVAFFEARSQARLLRGETAIARWSIAPDHWQAFITLNKALDQSRAPDLINSLTIRPRPTATDSIQAPVEIIVGAAGAQIDGDYYDLPTGMYPVQGLELLPGPPPCLEFALLWAGGDTSDVRNSLRFPIPPGPEGEELAARILSHYHTTRAGIEIKPLIPIRHTGRVIAILLILAALSAAAFLTGFLLRTNHDLGQAPALAAILGGTLTPGMLILALTVYVRSKM